MTVNTKPHYQAVKIADPFYVDNLFSQPTKLADNWCALVIPVTFDKLKSKSKVQTQPIPKSKKKGKGEFGLWAASKISWAIYPHSDPLKVGW